MYYPLPFNKRLKITAYHPGRHEMVRSDLVPVHLSEVSARHAGRNVERQGSRFAGRAKQFEQLGKDPKPPVEGKTAQEHALAGPRRNENRL